MVDRSRPSPQQRAARRIIRAGAALSLCLALIALSRPWTATAEPGPERAGSSSGSGFWLLPPDERLTLHDQRLALQDVAGTPPVPAYVAENRPNWLLTSLITAGAVAGVTANAVLDGPQRSWHFGNEGWFERDSHYGGADKGSHFTDYYIVSKEFTKLFVVLGHPLERARWLGAGAAALTGLANEIGDGTTRYGFSYEDLVMDVGGALSAALINAAGAEDLVGFRRGFANFDNCCNYTNEIFTGDLRLAGVARRLGLDIGPLKYLLLSVTYGTRGYPGELGTERRVGVEVGLDFKQMLDDLNVRRQTWWGYALHVVFDNIRLPYTAVGFRYDMNHGKWYGPNAGN